MFNCNLFINQCETLGLKCFLAFHQIEFSNLQFLRLNFAIFSSKHNGRLPFSFGIFVAVGSKTNILDCLQGYSLNLMHGKYFLVSFQFSLYLLVSETLDCEEQRSKVEC